MKRKDAKRVLKINATNQLLIDLKPKRSLGELYLDEEIDVTNLVSYIETLKVNDEGLTFFHAFVTAIGKLLYERPLLNNFVANRHIYVHNDVQIAFVMKVDLLDKAQEVMVVMPIQKEDNLFTISNKVREKVNGIRNHQVKVEGANKAINFLSSLPNILRIPCVGIFKWCDKHGLLPANLIKDNIYYSSIIVSDIGSLKSDCIYHNITDFGTCSGLITIGEIKERMEKVKGKEVKKYYCHLGITIDERIADGYYFIKSIHLMEYIMQNPSLLELNMNNKINFEKSSKNASEKD